MTALAHQSSTARAVAKAERAKLFPTRHRGIMLGRGTWIELTGPADIVLRIIAHYLPLCDPADCACDSEEHREHSSGEAHRLERDARIEVDVGIKLLLDEVLVVQGDLLELHGDIKQRVVLDT